MKKNNCFFQSVLNKYSIPSDDLEIVEIENRDDCQEIQDYMKKITGGRSVSTASYTTNRTVFLMFRSG